ncbi:MAG: hypothetical protein ACXADC_02455 [Candidatus Thorarchaeota archaeon]|jgi:hypothetical protein
MKLLDRLLGVFNRQRNLFLGAVGHPDTLAAYIHQVRAQTYLKLTGKKLTQVSMKDVTSSSDSSELSESVSRVRRITRGNA